MTSAIFVYVQRTWTSTKIVKPEQASASELNLCDVENFPITDNEPDIVRKSDNVQDKSDNSNHFLPNSRIREKPQWKRAARQRQNKKCKPPISQVNRNFHAQTPPLLTMVNQNLNNPYIGVPLYPHLISRTCTPIMFTYQPYLVQQILLPYRNIGYLSLKNQSYKNLPKTINFHVLLNPWMKITLFL